MEDQQKIESECRKLANSVRKQCYGTTTTDLAFDPVTGEFRQVSQGESPSAGAVVTQMTQEGFAAWGFETPKADAHGSAIIYRSELDYISRCILDYPNIETGGQLFGYWSAKGEPVVLFAIGPGPRANHEVAFFNQDLDYLTEVGGALVERFGLHHIGEWHSHHQLGLARPSGHDAANMSTNIVRENLGRFLLCIGTCDGQSSVLNAFNFVQGEGCDFVQAAWHVVEAESPFRLVVDQDEEMQRMIVDPFTLQPVHGANLIAHAGPRLVKPDLPEGVWLQRPGNGRVLKRMQDAMASCAEGGECRVQLDNGKNVLLTAHCGDEDVLVVLPPQFPEAAPIVVRDGEPFEVEWPSTGDVFADFEHAFGWLFEKNTKSEAESGKSTEPSLIDVGSGEAVSETDELEAQEDEPEAQVDEPEKPLAEAVEETAVPETKQEA